MATNMKYTPCLSVFCLVCTGSDLSYVGETVKRFTVTYTRNITPPRRPGVGDQGMQRKETE